MPQTWTSSVTGADPWRIPIGDDGDANEWAQFVVLSGGTVSAARLNIVGTLVQGLKADGIWSKLDRLWLFAAENATSALVDIKNLGVAGTVGSPTLTVNRGYAGTDVNPATNYISTNVILSTLGGQYSLNSGHLSVWLTTNTATTNGGASIGGGTGSELYVANTDGNIYASINEASTPNAGTPRTRMGHWIANRTGSLSSNVYFNGNNFSGVGGGSTALSAVTLTVLATNVAGTVSFGNPNMHAMASIGSGMTTLEAGRFYSRLRDYMNAVGVP